MFAHRAAAAVVILRGMTKAVEVDDRLLAEARAATGAATDAEVVRLGLEALVRHAAYQRLRTLRGSEPHATDVPRARFCGRGDSSPARKSGRG